MSAIDSAERGLDGLAADVALARGRALHARFLADRSTVVDPDELDLFEHAAQLYRATGDHRGEGEALFWVGCFHQVVRGDHDAATAELQRAGDLARDSGDDQILSYVLRHLGIAEHAADRLESANELLDRSTALRRSLGFRAGVAANLVGLAYIAQARGDEPKARELLAEAERLAIEVDAEAIRSQVEEALRHLPKERG